MKRILIPLILLAASCTHHPATDYRTIAFTQNELIIAYEEKLEELHSIIQTAFPAYTTDYHDIDSLSNLLDSLYLIH